MRLEVRLKGGDTFVGMDDTCDIFCEEAAVGTVGGEELGTELRELLPEVGKGVELVPRNLAGHQGVEVVRRFFLCGGDVTRDVEVVALSNNLLFRDEPRKVRDVAPHDDGVVDALHVRLLQNVLCLVFLEGLGASMKRTSLAARFFERIMTMTGMPVEKKRFDGRPMIVSMLLFSMRFLRISSSAPPRKRTPCGRTMATMPSGLMW